MGKSKKHLFTCVLCIGCWIGSMGNLYAQKIQDAVVLIEATSPLGEESGAGIMVGNYGNEVYIITAHHVVEDAEVIEVVLFGDGWRKPYVAIKDPEYVHPRLDLAVLKIEIPSNHDFIHPRLVQADHKDTEYYKPVNCIGHPNKSYWQVNKSNHIQGKNRDKIEITETSVVNGFSGGALTSRKKDHLIGMIARVTDGSTVAIPIAAIKDYLHQKRISYNFLEPAPIPLKKFTWVLGGLAAGGLAVGVDYNDRAYQDFRFVRNNFDATAFVGQGAAFTNDQGSLVDLVGGRTPEQIIEDGNQHLLYRDISYGLAGAFLLTGILINKKKIENGRVKKNQSYFTLGKPQLRPGFSAQGALLCLNFTF